MKCLQCESPMVPRRENHHYRASGLDGVTLVGVEVSRCTHCGAWEVSIPRIETLHRTIALALARKPAPLDGAEIRFLRKNLGWSGIDFALYMGVTAETVSRWENGRLKMGPPADRLLRMMVMNGQHSGHDPLEALKTIRKDGPGRLKLQMRLSRGGWAAA
jgi:putative transcriptional regulator